MFHLSEFALLKGNFEIKKEQLTMVDEPTKKTLASIPLLRTNAGPRDGEQWASRLKEEYLSLIKVCYSACYDNYCVQDYSTGVILASYAQSPGHALLSHVIKYSCLVVTLIWRFQL